MVHTTTGSSASGFGQIGAAAAIKLGDDDVGAAVAEWERRHDELDAPVRRAAARPRSRRLVGADRR